MAHLVLECRAFSTAAEMLFEPLLHPFTSLLLGITGVNELADNWLLWSRFWEEAKMDHLLNTSV